MTVVVDVSGVIEILLCREKADKFDEAMQGVTQIVTPDLYISELTNTLWKYYTKKMQPKNKCIDYIKDGIDFIDKFIDSKEIWEEAFVEGINNKHSIYDMFYMVAARRNNATLITNDAILAAICKKNHIQVCC
jgi:predicted nucleic acid-binding protein